MLHPEKTTARLNRTKNRALLKRNSAKVEATAVTPNGNTASGPHPPAAKMKGRMKRNGKKKSAVTGREKDKERTGTVIRKRTGTDKERKAASTQETRIVTGRETEIEGTEKRKIGMVKETEERVSSRTDAEIKNTTKIMTERNERRSHKWMKRTKTRRYRLKVVCRGTANLQNAAVNRP